MRLSGDMLPYVVDLLAGQIPWGLVYYRCLSPAASRKCIKQNNFYSVQRKFLHNSGYDLLGTLLARCELHLLRRESSGAGIKC